jgi:hypothetical protein
VHRASVLPLDWAARRLGLAAAGGVGWSLGRSNGLGSKKIGRLPPPVPRPGGGGRTRRTRRSSRHMRGRTQRPMQLGSTCFHRNTAAFTDLDYSNIRTRERERERERDALKTATPCL